MIRVVLVALLLQGCVFFSQPSKVGPGWYLVKPTDTLYALAWRYQVDFKTLAQWNGLKAPYKIVPGQYVRLVKPNSVTTKPIITASSSQNKTPKTRTRPKKLNKIISKPINWVWPVKGNLLNRFNFNDISKRGIDIANKVRQPIVAVASGKVVYSGNGLAGYKNLIIIKHNEIYLTAYAQNKNLLVKEGDVVKKGMKIADMGKADKVGFKLHFQVRKNGKPVNPLSYLPKK